MKLYPSDHHENLIKTEWSLDKAQHTINCLYHECLNTFDGKNFWHIHPDMTDSFQISKMVTGIWNGVAGTFWALKQLRLTNPSFKSYDAIIPYLDLLETEQASRLKELLPDLGINPNAIGYLLGYSGSLLVKWQFTQDKKTLDKLEKYINQNIHNPNNEFMWSSSGTALIACFLYQQTNESRWAELFKKSISHMLNIWDFDSEANAYTWIQDMYGTKARWYGLVHGFTGNISVMLQGLDILDEQQKEIIISRSIQTFVNTAITNETHANWVCGKFIPSITKDSFAEFLSPTLLQLCHGSPGTLIGFEKLWQYMDQATRSIYIKGANLIWDAGPLIKPWGLCHGTAGNGYAFLKLYTLTKDTVWLDRARKFAMHAIYQSEKMQEKYGMIRVDNWCGDMGLALYLQDCIDGKSNFPMLDYF